MNWFIACLLFGLTAVVSSEDTHETTLRTSLDSISSNLYKHASEKNEGKNMVMSPLSAQIALAMLSMGAEGKTLDELQTSLLLPDKKITEAAFKEATNKYNDDKAIDLPQKLNKHRRPIFNPNVPTLRIVNKLYLKDGPMYEFVPHYKQMAVDSFRSEVENVDFTKQTEAAKKINSWVEEKTNKKIKNIVSSDSLGGDVRVMLINAIYFKGTWKTPFYPERTKKDTFSVSKDVNVEVDFMNKEAFYHFVQLPDWKSSAVKLPFHDSDYFMLFILPNQVNGLKTIENQLASANLKDVLDNMKSRHLDLSIPKFRIESDINLKEILQKMGISKMFTKSAEFSGIIENNESIFVSDVRQKAFIEVDEYGCEAAATTKMTISWQSVPRPFKVNVPFYYAVVDGNGNRIFSGRIVNPKH